MGCELSTNDLKECIKPLCHASSYRQSTLPYGSDTAASPGAGLGLFAVGESDVVEVVDHERRRHGVVLVVVVAAALLEAWRGAGTL